MYEVIEAGRAESVKYFNEWSEEVKRTVPKDRLLIFEVGGQKVKFILEKVGVHIFFCDPTRSRRVGSRCVTSSASPCPASPSRESTTPSRS